MCILFIHRNPDAGADLYKVIVASNRDEFYKRPAKPAHFWENNSDCLGGIFGTKNSRFLKPEISAHPNFERSKFGGAKIGRPLGGYFESHVSSGTDNEPGREGGTWLAISTTGRAGIILNLTGETRPHTDPGKGRGNLIVDYVTSRNSAEDYLSELHEVNRNGQPYNPYNLVLLDMHDASVRYLSSELNSAGPQQCLDDILGFGNSLMDQPYQKVQAGKVAFKKIITGATVHERDRLVEDLRQLLKSEERHLPDPELQRRSAATYETLSSIFVHDEDSGYGTRTHSILLVDGENRVTFVEETRMPDKTWKTQLFETTLK